MNEPNGHPAPTLPAPGIAPAAPAPSAPSAPSAPTAFAMPIDAAVDLPAPSAAVPLTAASLPAVTAPTLPSAGGIVARPAPAPETAPAATLATPSAPPAPLTVVAADTGTAPPKTTNSRAGAILAISFVLGAGALGAFGFITMSGDSTPDPAEPPVVTEAPVATSPLVAPIVDARNVVDEINDNEAEAELLGEIGLDPLGEPTEP